MDANRSYHAQASRRGRSEVRDIAEDLKERIEATQSELALIRGDYEVAKREIEQTFLGRFNKTQDRLRALELLFEEETGERLPIAGQKNNFGGLRLPMADFIINTINTSGVKSKVEIKELVDRAGYGSDESNGRAVHTTLMNLVKAGRLVVQTDGYAIPEVDIFK